MDEPPTGAHVPDLAEPRALFASTDLAGRIERAEAQLVAAASDAARVRRGDAVGFVMSVAGGIASFADQDSSFNKVAGLGFAGLPTSKALDDTGGFDLLHTRAILVKAATVTS
jgi:hypothetical protein